MPPERKTESRFKPRIILFCSAAVVLLVALRLLPDDAWAWRGWGRRLAWIPVPPVVALGLSWLGGWLLALFGPVGRGYRGRGLAIVVMALILGALMFAPIRP